MFNMHPTGKHDKAERLKAVMGPGGIHECGNAQNCVRVCPKEIPVKFIAQMNREFLKALSYQYLQLRVELLLMLLQVLKDMAILSRYIMMMAESVGMLIWIPLWEKMVGMSKKER